MRYEEELTTVIGKLHRLANKVREHPDNFGEELAAAYESATHVLWAELSRHRKAQQGEPK